MTDPQAVVAGALLLRHWWSRPTEPELENWAQLWSEAHAAELELRPLEQCVSRLETALEDTPADVLAEEYERLLVGPGRVPCAPYESVWRTEVPAEQRTSLMGAPADEVLRIYEQLGVRPSKGEHELPDHLLVELEAFAFALDHEETAAGRELLTNHLLRWIAPFCSAVGGATEVPWYATLAELTPTWAASLAGP